MNNTHFNDLIQGFSPPSHPFIAIDMEWQNSDRAPDKKPNELLSIQWSCIDADGGYWEGIHYPKKRLKLSQTDTRCYSHTITLTNFKSM